MHSMKKNHLNKGLIRDYQFIPLFRLHFRSSIQILCTFFRNLTVPNVDAWIILQPHHCVALSRTGLTICQNTAVVSIQTGRYNWQSPIKHFFLCDGFKMS